MRLKTPTLLILLLTGLLLAVCDGKQPQLAIEAIDTDWGHVVNGDILSRELTVWNNGQAELVIDSVTTSCGCTEATLSSMVIAPGASSTLTIEFDSGAHGPELTGELIRQIFIASNDPKQPEAQIELVIFVDPKSS